MRYEDELCGNFEIAEPLLLDLIASDAMQRTKGISQHGITALLHDISHKAFSHIIEFVLDDHSGQSYHEQKKMEFVANTDIPAILNRYGMDWREFMHDERFSLLEQPSPALV
jgi:HD superfamily phosphohydrolase